MNKNTKTWLVILIYLVLIAACFSVVHLIDRLSSPGPEVVESSAVKEETQPETATPADAERPEDTRESGVTHETSAQKGKKNGAKKPPAVETPTASELESEPETEPVPETKPSLIIATDLHYYPSELTDYGEAFQKMEQQDDGKVAEYSSQLLDAFFDEVIKQSPTALVLSGDLTINGERTGHEELAKKLKDVEEAGVQVLVIPGNHDINNPNAAEYFGKELTAAPSVNAEEFGQIYQEFGYDQAISRDESSLSYIYPLDSYTWMMMLDSCQYDPKNLVGGSIRSDTFTWMEEQLKLAAELGISVVPVAHHNLLKESILYPTDCTIENSPQLITLLERYTIPVFFSGHLHLQRIKRYKPEPGAPDDVYQINEVVSDSISISPFQYGSVTWNEENLIQYHTQEIDVDGWAKENGLTDENLLNFRQYGIDHLRDIVREQIIEKMTGFPDYQMEAMATLYAELNSAYCAGTVIDGEKVKSTDAFRLWERNLPDSKMFQEMDDILRDTAKDHNRWQIPQ